jgi:hypothetical protein
LDWQTGYRKYKYKRITYPNGEGVSYIPDGLNPWTEFSLGLTLNYTVYKGWYVGGGFEPTFLHTPASVSGNLEFSMPALYRVGYDFKTVDVSVSRTLNFIGKQRNGMRLNLLVPLGK